MESASEELQIHCSQAAKELVRAQDKSLVLTRRGTIQVKGKGHMTTYWLKGYHATGHPSDGRAQSPSRASPEPTPAPVGAVLPEPDADVEVSIGVV